MARTNQPHKLTFDAFVAKATDWCDPRSEKHRNLDYHRPETRAAFNGSKSIVPIWCNVHNTFFTQKVNNHLANGQGCPECGAKTKADKRRSVNWEPALRLAHGDRYDYSRVRYTNRHAHITIVCKEHGAFEQEYGAHALGAGCPACWEERRSAHGAARTAVYQKDFAQRATVVHNGQYRYPETPADATAFVGIECPTHGVFTQRAYSHLGGVGCPACGHTTPYTQLEVAALIRGYGVDVEDDNTTVLGGKHIDMWVPARKIGVEYHGSYWHTEARRGSLHRLKWERATAAGVRLVQIFDFEWKERRTAVENRLAALFGVGPVRYARKLRLADVGRSSATAFYDMYHTQGGSGLQGESWGLYDGTALVACVTVGASRFTPDMELRRYASVGRVVGGFSRLFTHYVRTHKPATVMSYCDLRWGAGQMYEAAGFQKVAVTEPDYWWTDGDRRISRYTAQMRPEGVAERDYAESKGWSRVLGVGHSKWLWTAPVAPTK